VLNNELLIFNPLNAELNPIRHLLALTGAHHFVHVSRVRVNIVVVYGLVFNSVLVCRLTCFYNVVMNGFMRMMFKFCCKLLSTIYHEILFGKEETYDVKSREIIDI
jgi:hypothetical protein